MPSEVSSSRPAREEAPPAPAQSARGIGREVLGFTLLALALRLLLLWAPAADMVGVSPSGEPYDYHGEEFNRGNIAAQVLRGPLLRILDYQWTEGFGGSLVVGLLAVPLFHVLGENLFALKLVPVGFGLLMVAAAYLIGLRLGGRTGARWCALLTAVGFPGLIVFQTLAWGTHAEVAALTAFFAWISLRALADERPSSRLRFLQGLVAGFSLYFGFGFGLFLVSVAGFELLQRRSRLLMPSSLAAALGLAVGLLPWLVYNLRHGFVGHRQYGRSVIEHFNVSARGVSNKALEIWTDVFPKSIYLRTEGVQLTSAWTWVLLGALLAAVLVQVHALLRRRRLEPAWIFVAHIVLFTVVASAWRHLHNAQPRDLADFRYPLLVVPSIFVLAGLGLETLWRGAGWRRPLAVLLACTWVLTSLFGTLRLADPSRAGTLYERDGARAASHGRWLVLRYSDNIPLLAKALERAETRRTPQEREVLYEGMGKSLGYLNDWVRAELEQRRPVPRDAHYRELYEWLQVNAPPEHRHLFQPITRD